MVDRSLLRFQAFVTLSTLLLVAGTYAIVGWAARSPALSDWVLQRQLTKWREGGSRFMYTGMHTDAGSYLLLDELPEADYSQGGAYFVGSSTMLHATTLWELPPELRARIHNYAVNSANVDEQAQWIRFLIEEEGLLVAGGAKTRIILGLNAFDTRMKRPGSNDELYVDQLFARHGLYSYDPKAGMARVPMSDLERQWSLLRLRAQNALMALWSHLDFPSSRRFDEAAHVAGVRRRLEAGLLDEDLQFSMPILEGLLDDLRVRDVDVVGVLLPVRRWAHELPFQQEFAGRVQALFEARGSRVVDLSHLLDEQDFYDAGHPNVRGQTKLGRLLEELALEHVRKL